MIKSVAAPLMSLLLLCTLSVSAQSEAESTDQSEIRAALKKEFNQTYKAYQQSLSEKKQNVTRRLAEESYNLGCKLYGKSTLNCANLGVNLILKERNNSKQVIETSKNILPILQKEYGEKSLKVIDIMVLAASKYPFKENELAMESLDTALSYLQQVEDVAPLHKAKIEINAGKKFLQMYHSRKYSDK